MPPIGFMPPPLVFFPVYLLILLSRFASLYSHHICLALNQHALMFRFGFGSTRTLSFIYTFLYAIPAADALWSTATCSPAFSVYSCTTLHLFLFSARSLLPPVLVTLRVVPPLPLTHPGYPTGPPTPPPTPDFRHPRIASVYQTSRNLARIYTTARHYSRIRHRSMLLSSRLDPFPYAFFGAHLVYHQFISLLGSGSRFRDVGSSRAWGLDSHVVILRRD